MTDITYPRTYRFGALALTFWVALELVIAGVGVAAFIFSRQLLANAPYFGWICCAVCLALALPALASTLRGKLVLYSDRIEYTGIFSTRVVYNREIKETRNPKRQYGHISITLVRHNSSRVRITDFGRMDQVLEDWINSFPNVELKARAERDAKLLANPAFGSSPTERELAVNGDAKRINLLRWPCLILAGWGWVYPHPYTWCLYALMTAPVLAVIMVMASRGKWTLASGSAVGKLSVGAVAIPPLIVLGGRAYFDDLVVDWQMPLIWSIAAALAMTGILALIERSYKIGDLLGVGFAFLIYAWGGSMFANVAMDIKTYYAYPVRVLGTMSGKYNDTFTVTHWDQRKADNNVSVSHYLYYHVHKGDQVCVYVHSGALGWPWYEVDACPSRP